MSSPFAFLIHKSGRIYRHPTDPDVHSHSQMFRDRKIPPTIQDSDYLAAEFKPLRIGGEVSNWAFDFNLDTLTPRGLRGVRITRPLPKWATTTLLRRAAATARKELDKWLKRCKHNQYTTVSIDDRGGWVRRYFGYNNELLLTEQVKPNGSWTASLNCCFEVGVPIDSSILLNTDAGSDATFKQWIKTLRFNERYGR